jgi:VanZ family protein
MTMKKARYFVPAILFYLLIFILSSQDLGIDLPGHGLDKVAHFFEFALQGFLLSLGFFNAFSLSPGLKSTFALLTGLFMGILDEFHQLFVPHRTSDIRDALADAAGIVAGILVYRYLAGRKKRAPEN